MSRNNAKIKFEAPVLTSPEGVKIQITAGRKLQEIRSYAEDPEITDAQFRALVCLVDRLNEGRSGDESRWGSAYPNYETIAKDIAKDERAAKRIIKELKTGRREIRSKSGERKLVPCKAVLNVKSTKKGKSDEVNEYRLKNWGAFVVAPAEGAFTAPQQSEKGAVTGQKGCGDQSEGVRSPARKRAVTAPDSSHLPSPEKHPTNPPQLAPASGERGPAGCSMSDEDPQRHQAANDNAGHEDADSRSPQQGEPVIPPGGEWPDDMPDKFMSYYPKGGDLGKVSEALEEIRLEGLTDYQDILRGAKNYNHENAQVERGHIKRPENFLRERSYRGYQKDNQPYPYKRTVAI